MEEEESQWGGSSAGRSYTPRSREAMDERLKALYFTTPCKYEPNIFRRHYRMQPWVFDRMMHDVANHDPYFVQARDATGRVGLSTEQKLTVAMRMLAYGLTTDLFDEFLDVAESTCLEILQHFTRAIWNVYHEQYLRQPTKADLRRLLNKAEARGFPGMVGSLDCSLNDINVLGRSPLFDDVSKGEAPRVKYHVNGRQYGQCYYLVDDIYPKWSSFVKAIKNATQPETGHFTKMQEAYRKDVERAFGILQARFSRIREPARGWSKENLQYIMMTCIILHNMIVEDERKEDEEEPFDSDDIPTLPRKADIYDKPNFHKRVKCKAPLLREFMSCYKEIRCPVVNRSLEEDLINHLWNMKLLQEEQSQE